MPEAKPATEADFLDALKAWRGEGDDANGRWRKLWLGPECAVLSYARAVGCDLSTDAIKELNSTLADDDTQMSRAAWHLGSTESAATNSS